MIVRKNVIDTPIGPLTTAVDAEGAVVWIDFKPQDGEYDPVATAEVDRQLREYFEGSRTQFDLRLADIGTPFQRRVWKMLMEIPFGETRSYGDLAKELGQSGASRAVGRANATNPIPIVVPCHRVVGSTGLLTGFAGGLESKRWLIDFERRGRGLGSDVPTG